MPTQKDLYSRYMWLVETLRLYGRLTSEEINRKWLESTLSNGRRLSRRTIYNYRNAILDVFGFSIEVDRSTYEYYIDSENTHATSVADWLLNAKAEADLLTEAHDVSDRIFLENVPSAREHLGTMIQALRGNHRVTFDYHGYMRAKATEGVKFEPYFLKIFKQRWYVVGRHVQDNKIKTYALDRMRCLKLTNKTFVMPVNFHPAEYFRDAFGITVGEGQPRRISLQVDPRTAHYLRDLPLHHSQSEVIHDNFSIFYYNMRISNDLIMEILSYGARMKVLGPPELQMQIAEQVRASAAFYDEQGVTTDATKV